MGLCSVSCNECVFQDVVESGGVYCRVGKIIFLELLGSLFRKTRGIRIANQDFIILNQRGQQGGMNEKLLRSPSNRCLPTPINGFVPHGAKNPGILIFGKGLMLP